MTGHFILCLVTAPMVFVALGIVLSQTGLMAPGSLEAVLHPVAELALVVLFALLIVDQISHGLGEQVLHLAVNTIWISALLHGVIAAPGARWYRRKVAAMAPCAETQPIETSAKPLVTTKP